jgi:dTDP-4-dehydrorhamnose 3,5-epimerase
VSTDVDLQTRVVLDLADEPTPDPATVTPDGRRLERLIEGVRVRPAIVQSDERGSVTEMFNPAWDFSDEPLVYAYTTTIRPGQKKGWVVHHEQSDRLFYDNGAAKIVLYDAREGSPTKGLVNEIFLGAANRALLLIPPGVVHAVVNIGETELRFVNMPTRPYDHARPDKSRLPADTPAIPYQL